MYHFYRPTPLELWIERLWRKAGITTPDRLTIDEVSSRLNVWVHYMNHASQAMEWMGMRSILIDKRLGRAEQWADFLHELCHVLRHSGNQTLMPRAFVEQQEAEANRFTLYAGVPFFMLRRYALPERRSEAIEWIASHFGLPYALAGQRLDQIQRRIFEGILREELANVQRAGAKKKSAAP